MKKKINEILDSLRIFITEHDDEDTPILTAYVDLDSTDQDNRRDRPAWLIELKNEAKRIDFLHGAAAEKLNEFGGIAATLYYSGR